MRDASERLQASLEQLRRMGIEASGEVGDADPVLAAQDALRKRPADEVVILERAPQEARWFEEGLFQRAQEELSPPLKLILVDHDSDGAGHVTAVEQAPAGTEDVRRDVGGTVEISENMPRFSRADLAGMVLGVVGTIVAAILAATVGPEKAAGAVAILIAIGIALINLAHVVGLLLMESVRYRGGFETFFRTLALVGTPAAVLVNLVIALTN
jgi:hypothetical protein